MMLASIAETEILDSREYIFEPKLDGYRALLYKNGSKIELFSRSGRNMTAEYREIAAASRHIKGDCILDGEIVVYDENGNPSFSLMQRRKEQGLVSTFVAFDVLELKGKDMRRYPLLHRKKILARIVDESEAIQTTSYTDKGRKLWHLMNERNLEGVIAKKKTSLYIDRRSKSWLKIKIHKTADCIIIGVTHKTRIISSFALGLHDKGKIVHVGNVGTGFDDEFARSIDKMLIKEENGIRMDKSIMPVRPERVCEVRYDQFTGERFRAPVFLRLRDDKLPGECEMNQVLQHA